MITASTSVPAITCASSRVSTSAGSEIATSRVVPSKPTGSDAAAPTEVLGEQGDGLGVGGRLDEVAVGEVEDAGQGSAQVLFVDDASGHEQPTERIAGDALFCQCRLDISGGDEAVGDEPVTEPGPA